MAEMPSGLETPKNRSSAVWLLKLPSPTPVVLGAVREEVLGLGRSGGYSGGPVNLEEEIDAIHRVVVGRRAGHGLGVFG